MPDLNYCMTSIWEHHATVEWTDLADKRCAHFMYRAVINFCICRVRCTTGLEKKRGTEANTQGYLHEYR